MNSQKDLVLGLDIGTSSIKFLLLNLLNNKIEYDHKISTNSARILTENSKFDEQNVQVILELIQEGFNKIPFESLQRLNSIQLCGQMHGVVLWNKESKKHSNLITWQDERCDSEFLKSLPVKSISDLSTGFGCASLFWLEFNSLLKESNFDSAGTIHDYVTFLLSNQNLMSNQNALSWGYFDLKQNSWQMDLVKSDKFPSNLLPKVDFPGHKMSHQVLLLDNFIKLDSIIYNALGDLQCSVMSCLENETDCVINISTSAQICVSVDSVYYETIKNELPLSVTCYPYFKNRVLLVSASLNGGNVLEKFVDSILNWQKELLGDLSVSRDQVWKKLVDLGLKSNSSLICEPILFGERHDMKKYASICNIQHDNFSLGQVFKSICDGLARNLHQMITKELILNKLKCKRIIATGGALCRNSVLRSSLESEFNYIPIFYKESADAAYGAALFLKSLIR
ncbi:unnamed protein product [Brachionus calyciflorus]|uniref:Carbohydrate kinase FGGY N-terminal domain-containing protein n=1 Tax=Brachionus calyciflorus TaxID=104777 RepID=A0A814JWU5_9BILA|nr:unnamed protein product [Brachionus calyciflorus]